MIPLSDVLRIAGRHFARNLRRNLLSSAMLGVGLASLLLQQAYGYRYKRHLLANAAYVNYSGHVSIYRHGALDRAVPEPEDLLMPDDIVALEAALQLRPEVAFVSRYLVGFGVVSNGCSSVPFIGLGLDQDADSRIRNHSEAERWLLTVESEPMQLLSFAASTPDAVTVTPSMAAKLGKSRSLSELEPGAETQLVVDCEAADLAAVLSRDAVVQLMVLGLDGEPSTLDAEIVQRRSTGRLVSEDVALRSTLPLMQRLLRTEGITYLAVFLREGVDAEQFAEEWNRSRPAAVRGRFDAFAALSEELNASDRGTILWQRTTDVFVLALLGTIVAIVLVNFWSMAVVGRRGEIETMRAIGFRPREVIVAFFAEFLLVAVAGTLSGIAMAVVAMRGVNALGIKYSPPGIAGEVYLAVDVSFIHMCGYSAVLGAIALVATLPVVSWYARRPPRAGLLRQGA